MSGTHAFILLVTIATLLTLSIMWKDWLTAKEHEHWQDAALKTLSARNAAHQNDYWCNIAMEPISIHCS